MLRSHLPGSAVCAFSVKSIKTAMNGRFLDRSSTLNCRKKPTYNQPSRTLTTCQSDNSNYSFLFSKLYFLIDLETLSAAFGNIKIFYSDDDALQFIKNHQMLFDSVQPVDNKAIFTSLQTGLRFTSIAVESVRVRRDNISVMYIGKSEINDFVFLRKNTMC